MPGGGNGRPTDSDILVGALVRAGADRLGLLRDRSHRRTLGPELGLDLEVLASVHRLHLLYREVVATRDERAHDLLGEIAVALDVGKALARRLEVREDVDAPLLALDLVGEPALVPLLHGDHFCVAAREDLVDVRDHAVEVGRHSLGDQEHRLIRIHGCLGHGSAS